STASSRTASRSAAGIRAWPHGSGGWTSTRGSRPGADGPALRALPHLFHLLARAVAQLLGVLLAAFLGRLGGALGCVLRHLLAALQSLLPRFLRALLHLVGHRADLLVLDSGGRDEHSGQEAHGQRTDRESNRILLGHTRSLPRALRDLPLVRRDAGDLVANAADLVGHPRGHVCLVTERLHGVAHAASRRLYLLADLAWVLAHCTSSLVLSIACSGAGGVACWTLWRPCSASTPAAAAHRRPTISAASQECVAEPIAPTTASDRKISASRALTPAPPNIPTPTPACLPFSDISALASSISCLTSVVVSCDSCRRSSPTERSCRSLLWVAIARSRSSGACRPCAAAGSGTTGRCPSGSDRPAGAAGS